MKVFVIFLVLVGFTVSAVSSNMAYGLPIPVLCDYDNPRINLVPIKNEFSPEEPITIKVDSVPEDTLKVIVRDPKNMETFSDVIKTDSAGNATIDIPMQQNPLKGTWKVFVISHSNESQEVAFVGVGQSPKQHLTINPYQITHPSGKNSSASFLVVGDPEQSSSVRVFDSNGNNVYHNEVVILPSEGHCRYSLDLTGFDSDAYTIALSSGSESASADFNVGIQPSVSPISIKTPLYSYHAGDAVLILGDMPPDVDVDIDVYDPTGSLFTQLSLLAHNGKMSTSFHLPEDVKTGTWKINARSGSNFDVVEINVDGFEVFASQNTISPLKQTQSGIPFNEIQCKQNLLLIQKYDGTPACVKPDTKQKLVERGWTGSQTTDLIDISTMFCGKSFEQIQSETTFHILNPQILPEGYSLKSTDDASLGTILLSYAKGNTCGTNPDTLSDGKIELVIRYDPDRTDESDGIAFLDSYKEKYEQNNIEYKTNITDEGLYIIGTGMGIGKSITVDENGNTIHEEQFDDPARVYVLDSNTNVGYKITAYFPLDQMMNIAKSLS